MTAQRLAETRLVDGLPAKRLLEGLARVYKWLLVTDSDRRVLWMSDGLANLFGHDALEVGEDARHFVTKMPRPEQVFPLRTALRRRSHLTDIPIELRTCEGEVVQADVTLTRIDTDEPGCSLLLAVARPYAELEPDDRERGVSDVLVDHAPQAILSVGADGFIEHANPAAEVLTGRSREQLVGYPAALLFGSRASDLECVAASMGGADSSCRALLERPDGTRIEVDASVAALGQGRRGIYLRDSDSAEVEAELRRTNDELEHCVNSLAHDLRSPLVALLGFSRLLRQEYDAVLDTTGQHFLDRIEQAGRTMEALVHDLLELSRIGQAGDRPTMVDPRGVLVALRAELKPRLDESDIRLDLPETPPLVYCDRTRLYQLFANLVGNAIDHMGEPEDGRIEVAVREADEGVHITVCDNGRGIDSTTAAQVFEAFQSFPRGEGRRGTGMGLAIVKKIAEKLGGRVWLESAPGEGATFHVLLPSI
ncbi:MAG: sensor histidine kinase [Myxococcota bacterium]